jgi:hypothetical protein
MVVHHIPPENLSTFIALLAFFVSTTPSFHFVCKNFLETELGAHNDKDIFPVFTTDHLATSTGSIFTPAAWDTPGTQLLQLKIERGAQLIF